VVRLDFRFEEIDAIINARSLAIVGASGKPLKFGSLFTASQLAFGFSGPLYLVNPSEKEIMGHPCYPDLASLPEVPELVYIAIPAYRSLDILRECARLGVKGVVLLAAGFREMGDKGAQLEMEAVSIARNGGFRIIGPNCFGIYNPRNRLTLLPGHDFSGVPGEVAFISQSGGFSAQVARMAGDLGIHFSAVVSYGNGADLNEIDLLRYFDLDPATRVISAYLEGTSDGRGLFEVLKAAASRKDVVIWKVGKSESSRRAAASHTGSLAGATSLWEGLFRQCGVIEVSGVDELCDVLLALKHLGRRPGRRILISGGGGGLGAYAGDLAEAEGLEVPLLHGDAESRLRVILDYPGASVGNPLDIGTPLIHLPLFEAAMREAALNPTTDALVFDLALNFALGLAGEAGVEAVADVLIKVRRETGKPVILVAYSRALRLGDMAVEELSRRVRDKLLSGGVLVYPSMPRAMRALSLVNR